jgi:hypothetical protein
MNPVNEKRTRFRRYEDRRTSLMLSVHEILFDEIAGKERDTRVIGSVKNNFQADRTALLAPLKPGAGRLILDVAVGDWPQLEENGILEGTGIDVLLSLQREAPGAVALIRFKRPAVFNADAWKNLWEHTLKGAVTALLSVRISPERASPGLLWIMQSNYSREWSSRDRELVEEVASLIARVRDRDLDSNHNRDERS